MSKSTIKLGLLAVGCYVIWLVVFSPAWLLTSALGNGWHWQQVKGSLWQGEVSQLQYQQLHFSQVQWDWQWPLQWEVTAGGENLRFRTLASSDGDLTELTKGRGEFQYKGEPGLELTFLRNIFDSQGCTEVMAARWQLKGRLASELTRFGWHSQGVLQCQNGQYVSETGAGQLVLSFKRGQLQISLAGKVLPKAWLQPFYQS